MSQANRPDDHFSPKHAAEICVQALTLKRGIILIADALVRNRGMPSWDNRQRPEEQCYRLGFRIRNADDPSEVLWEGRYIFADEQMPAGSSEQVRQAVDVSLLSPGRYLLDVGVVLEQSFWFLDDQRCCVTEPFLIPARNQTDPGVRTDSEGDSEKDHILVIAPTLPLFDREAGGRRTFEMIRLLIEMGGIVTFLYEAEGAAKSGKYKEALAALGVIFKKGPLDFLADSRQGQYQFCIAVYHAIAGRYENVLRQLLPTASLIVDSQDVHWLREQRALEAGVIIAGADVMAMRKRREVEAYAKADMVWAASGQDCEAIRRELPGVRVTVIPIIQDQSPAYRAEREGNTVLFVGNFHHAPNETAAVWGAEICGEFRRRTGFQLVFKIVGANPTERILELASALDYVQVFPNVPALDLWYNQARVLLAPLKFGAGMKGKICEAAAHGVPVITSPIGNEGIGLIDGEEAFIRNSTEGFVSALEDIFGGKVDTSSMSERALKRVVSLCGSKTVRRNLETSLADLKVAAQPRRP